MDEENAFEFHYLSEAVIRITKDRKLIINPSLTEGEAAEKFWKCVKDVMAKEDWTLEVNKNQ